MIHQTEQVNAPVAAATPITASGRLHNLDYLRGLAAFGIMIYHYMTWAYDRFPADSFLGRVGIYGVSVFYILSGLTLFYVYHSKFESFAQASIDFVIKRCFRIFPLLWLTILFTLILHRSIHGVVPLLLNVTGLFGFVDWNRYIATGSWSIGNELVFYALFLPYIFMLRRNRILFVVASIVAFLVYIYFAFVVLEPGQTLNAQWGNYVNPLNQFFLFLGGVIMGYAFREVRLPNAAAILLFVAGFLLFIFLPAEGDTIQLVTGANRLLFTLSCFMICAGFYKMRVELPFWLSKPLSLLGEASYSVYLIHPLVYAVGTAGVRSILKRLPFNITPTIPGLAVSIAGTLVVSYFVYTYYEKYFMRLGKQVRVKEKAV